MFNNNSKNRSPPTFDAFASFSQCNFFSRAESCLVVVVVLSQQQFAKMHKLLKACIFNLVALQGEGKIIIKINHNNKLSIFDIYPSEKKYNIKTVLENKLLLWKACTIQSCVAGMKNSNN